MTKMKYVLDIFCLWSGILHITTLWNTQNFKMSHLDFGSFVALDANLLWTEKLFKSHSAVG
jgi:hypothetical protein